MRKRHFKSHVILLPYKTILVAIFVLFLSLSAVYLPQQNLSMPDIPNGVFLNAIGKTIVALHNAGKGESYASLHTVIERSILSIGPTEIMSKKYAAEISGITKINVTKQSTPAPTPAPEKVKETDSSAKDIGFINTPGYQIDATELLHMPLSFSAVDDKPKVLILHTHTSEAYAESENARSHNKENNVVSVGAQIASQLENAGIKTIHDMTENDNPSYNQSYKKALTRIEQNLAQYPSIEVVLDVHRDYIKSSDGTLVKPTVTTTSGETAAQIMFVIGTDNMGLYHPEWRHNLSFAVKIQNKLNQMQPGLCRLINIRTERFNQHATKGSMIIEVGTGVNTVQEAQLSGRLIGRAVASVLKD